MSETPCSAPPNSICRAPGIDPLPRRRAGYDDNPVALHLRGMKMVYESVKERGSTIIVSSTAVDSINLDGVAGITSLAKGAGTEPAGELPES